jgi:outer membrane protein OmpA-like peptidoglycan-associated protein
VKESRPNLQRNSDSGGTRVLKRTFLAILAVSVLFSASPATAQTVYQKSFSPQLFEPAIGVRQTFLSVEGAATAEHLGFGLGLFFNYQHKPLVLFTETTSGGGSGGFDISGSKETVLIRNHLTADLYGALGLRFGWFRLQIGMALPVNLWLKGNDVDDQGNVTGSFTSTSIGDLRIQLKLMLFEKLAGFSLAFSPIITIPTGCLAGAGSLSGCDKDGELGGDSNVSARPRFALSWERGKLLAALNVGAIFRESAQVFSSEVSHRLTYGVAGGYQVGKRWFPFVELAGQAGFGTKSDCREDPNTGKAVCTSTSSTDLDAFPLELLLGSHINLPKGFQVTAGLGFGLIKAIGSPQFRVLAGVRWAPDLRDTDGDGVYDTDDKCPAQPEDKDGFQDEDGCPDPDNDGDLIPDIRDKCPNEREDKDGFQDDDGCPELDNDNDGIPDLNDVCPFKPETKNGFQDKDGCPDVPDQDLDGVPDSKDKCPKQKEDKDGFQDDDGCPDPDNDGDGIPDNFDDCKNQPEDFDKFKDNDGCPDPDNDNDGIPDAQDKCPNKKETINGYKDTDGCPDKGRAQVIIKENKIVIVKKVYFATGRSKIKRRSYSILDQVALTLKANPQVKGIRIEGHTDSRGNKRRNVKLSQKRAEAVRDYLIGKGVASPRLFAIGYGPEKPIATNRTRRGRAKNRRVEFTILDKAPGTAKPAPKTAPAVKKPVKKAAPAKLTAKQKRAAKRAARKAKREAKRAARKAKREAARAARKAKREAKRAARKAKREARKAKREAARAKRKAARAKKAAKKAAKKPATKKPAAKPVTKKPATK